MSLPTDFCTNTHARPIVTRAKAVQYQCRKRDLEMVKTETSSTEEIPKHPILVPKITCRKSVAPTFWMKKTGVRPLIEAAVSKARNMDTVEHERMA